MGGDKKGRREKDREWYRQGDRVRQTEERGRGRDDERGLRQGKR